MRCIQMKWNTFHYLFFNSNLNEKWMRVPIQLCFFFFFFLFWISTREINRNLHILLTSRKLVLGSYYTWPAWNRLWTNRFYMHKYTLSKNGENWIDEQTAMHVIESNPLYKRELWLTWYHICIVGLDNQKYVETLSWALSIYMAH